MFETFIALGIILSLIYYEVTHLSPGGLITPGYFALFLDQPMRILSTFLVAAAVYALLSVLRRWLPLHGRRQFALAVALAVIIKLLLADFVIPLRDSSVALSSIGIIIPGLISHDMVKQSFWKTTASLLLMTALLFLVLLLFKGGLP